jgi:hypothetical protein
MGLGTAADELAVLQSQDPFGTAAEAPSIAAGVFAAGTMPGMDGQNQAKIQ